MRDVLRPCRNVPGVLDAATYTFVADSAQVYIALGSSARWEQDESFRFVAGVR
jgi:hypothetical protein